MKEFEIVKDNKKEIEEVVIFRDKDDLGRAFVVKEVLDKFHIAMPKYKLRLDTGDELYEIKPQEAVYIIEHANNKYAPYKIRYQNFDFKNELEDEEQKGKKQRTQEVKNTIRIFRDVNDSSRAFVTKDVIVRFHLENIHHKVLLGKLVVYEIDPVQAINIISNGNNPYAPYNIEYVGIEFDHVEKKKTEKEPVMPYSEPVMPYEEKVMPYEEKIVKEEKQPTGPVLRRPRNRRPDETEELYVAYLEGFYDALFGIDEKVEEERRRHKKEILKTKPVEDKYNSDDAYLAYLKKQYSHIFSDDALEQIKPKNLIQRRAKRPDESDKDYMEYVSMFYDTPQAKADEKATRAK